MYPVIAHIYGPIAIHSYGVMIAVGLMLCIWLINNNPLRKELITEAQFSSFLLVEIGAAIIGGKLFYLLIEWHSYNSWLDFFAWWEGGFSILGSTIVATFTAALYLKYYAIPLLPTLDLIARYAPLLQVFGRIGCFLAGCCYGKPTNLWYGVIYTNYESLAPLFISLQPTQIYSSLIYCMIFIFLWTMSSRLTKPGCLAMLYLILAGLERFLLDFLRADRVFISLFKIFPIFWNVSFYQWIALSMTFGGFIGFIVCFYKKDN